MFGRNCCENFVGEKFLGEKFWWNFFGGNAISLIPQLFKNIIFWVLEALCICICLCMCVFVFVSLRLGHCHHQIVSFQKIYGLYGLEHHTVEINGKRWEGELPMLPWRQTDNQKVKIELVS